ncbi:pilus assembly PilX N-terminal domain-containing protein [Clostridium magnum]|uniref:Type 4 fimbrial biogenesis protein PilX N-terminal domain-containing protein n=1 Tax=Clostridium magnum DSM 2767 TaxID=1121326 RepID=A0A162U3I4_9CLOT|nr:pilus assembly PilX N-terminal domain-containing protein [Clostridium magnum]KZL93391.1 hypothetical protein CLMAG_04150 [Clostridium magnum DSM 2767]SHI15950.1 hypothetical protein SAMN02745944_02819 [Clostridium magnum DSM 2767]
MKKKGSALLSVVIIMMITFIMASFMVEVSIKNNRIAMDRLNKTKAYYSAETGIYDFIDYINKNNCNVASGTIITNLYSNGGLYGDNLAVYKANLMSSITRNDVGNSKIYNFSIYSNGSCSSQGYVIVASVSIVYTDNETGIYNYSSYSINSKKVYRT